MSPSCEDRRSRLALALGEPRPWEPELEAHVAACAACAAFVERCARAVAALTSLESRVAPGELSAAVEYGFGEAARAERAARALEGLGRLEVPRTLDGKVVASTQAGHRQDRAVEHVSSLSSVPAPAELERAVMASIDPSVSDVPADLRQRVELELNHPELSVGRRLARNLTALAAPSELDERVDWTLRHLDELRPRRALRLVTGGLVAAAASILLWLGTTGGDAPAPERTEFRFKVVEYDSTADLSPFAARLFSSATGGLTDVRRR